MKLSSPTAGTRAALPLAAHERLIFALDVPGREEALQWITRLGDTVAFYKIGMELLASGDYFRVLDDLAEHGKRIFVDLKFFDIPATVAAVVRGLSNWPVTLCTVHGWHAAMMEAAAAARSGDLRVLAVTVLTSMDKQDLNALGIRQSTLDTVCQRALAARSCGLDGVIASGQEAAALRAAAGPEFAIVCPGVRPDANDDDQKRTVTVTQAFQAGADAIVVGRPIRLAADPQAAAIAIQQNIQEALQ